MLFFLCKISCEINQDTCSQALTLALTCVQPFHNNDKHLNHKKRMKYCKYCLRTDVDECSNDKHNCHAQSTCSNTDGGFTCTCNDGYWGDGVKCYGMLKLEALIAYILYRRQFIL